MLHTVVVAEHDDPVLRQTLAQQFVAAHVLSHSMADVKHGTAFVECPQSRSAYSLASAPPSSSSLLTGALLEVSILERAV